MDTKNLSPAFFTSLAVTFAGALLISIGPTIVAVLGWLVFIAGLILNVFSTLVVIQKAKGGPLPELIARADSSTSSDAVHGGTTAPESEAEMDDDEPDTQAQDIVQNAQVEDTEKNERIFRSRPRSRNR